MSVNIAILNGRLGTEPKFTTHGSLSKCTFTVATNENWTDKASGEKKEKTDWHDVIVWGKQAEICSSHLSKGCEVLIEGKNRTSFWQNKDGKKEKTTEIEVTKIQFLKLGKSKDNGTPRPVIKPKQEQYKPQGYRRTDGLSQTVLRDSLQTIMQGVGAYA